MDRKPYSAPPPRNENGEKIAINRRASHRRSTGNCKHKRKSIKMPSSTSLHSLVSILKPSTYSDQQSVPNVSFDDECNEIKSRSDSKSSINDDRANLSMDNSSQYHTAVEGDGESFKPMNPHAEGSISTQQSSTIGFRASFFSVLEKLGVWRSQSNLYKAPTSEIKVSARNSIASLYFRTFQGGKFQ
jgi:hypothetical protein